MATPRQAVELMMKEAGIESVDTIIKEGHKLKEVAEKYYLDISGKAKETGIGKEILGPVASLICCPTDTQKKLLEFLSQSREATRDFLTERFGAPAYNLVARALYAMGMADIKNRYVHRKNRLGYISGTHISVVEPYQDRIKKFWSDLFHEAQHKSVIPTQKINKKTPVRAEHNHEADTDPRLNIYRDAGKFLEDRVSLECFVDLHNYCLLNGACGCKCHEGVIYPTI